MSMRPQQNDNLDTDDALQRKVCPQLLPSLWDSPATASTKKDNTEEDDKEAALSSSCVCNNDKEETEDEEQVTCHADLMLYNQDDNDADISISQSMGLHKTTGVVQWQTYCYHISYPNNDNGNENDHDKENDNNDLWVDRTLCLTERYGPTNEKGDNATTQGQRDPLLKQHVSSCEAEFSHTAAEPKCQPLPHDNNNEWPTLLRDQLDGDQDRNCYKLVLETTTEGFADTTFVCPPVGGLSQTHGPSGGWMVVSEATTSVNNQTKTMEQQLRVPDWIRSDFDNHSKSNSNMNSANENKDEDMVNDNDGGATTTTTVFVGEVPKDAVVPQKNPSLSSSSSDSAAWSACLVVVAIMVLVCGLARHRTCARRLCRRKSFTKTLQGRRGHRKGSFSIVMEQQHGHHIPLAFQNVDDNDDEDHTEETQGENDDDEEEDELAAEVVFV